MGHMRIGTLPATEPWNGVVGRIGVGAAAPEVADATLGAARKAFIAVGEDAGFRQASYLLVDLALTGNKADAAKQLANLGITIPEHTSLAEVAMQISQEMDRRIDATRKRTDFGEMAQLALVGALVEHVQKHQLPLLALSRQDVLAAFKDLSKEKNFGAVARRFCAKLTDGTLNYFLSKTLATQIGEGQRFTTTNQVTEYETGMGRHCHEASAIMEEFAAKWFSKRRYLGGGKISRDTVDRFAWFGMQKMRLELEVRAKRDG
jgi:hypothetical protein